MGYYVDPKDGTDKEDFLYDHAVYVGPTKADAFRHFMAHTNDVLPVVLVDNGHFKAAAIAYCADELERFLDPTDDRPKLVFLIAKATLKECGAIWPEDEPWCPIH